MRLWITTTEKFCRALTVGSKVGWGVGDFVGVVPTGLRSEHFTSKLLRFSTMNIFIVAQYRTLNFPSRVEKTHLFDGSSVGVGVVGLSLGIIVGMSVVGGAVA